jgi:HK97 family phage major capsid protein
MSLKELREKRAGIAGEMQSLVTAAETDKRMLSDEDKVKFDAFDAQVAALDEDIARRERIESVNTRINQTGGRKTETEQPRTEVREGVTRTTETRHVEIDVLDRLPELPKSSKFRSKQAAYEAGRWVQALMGNADAFDYCRDRGLTPATRSFADWNFMIRAAGSNDFAKGGALVPTSMESAIIMNREERGIFRKNVDVVPMSDGSQIWPTDGGDFTAYPVVENNASSVTESNFNLGQVQLVAKEWGSLVRVSRTINEDAVISIAELVARKFGWAFGDAEDKAGFIGDGSQTYHGVSGIFTKINDGNHAGGIYTSATGHTAFSTLTLADFEGVVGQLPMWAQNGAAWYISQAGFSASMQRLLDASGGNSKGDLAEGTPYKFLGYPVVISQVLNATLTTQTATVVCGLGNLRKTSTMGDRRGFNVLTLNERYAELSQIGMFATSRWDIVNHELGNATVAGGFIGLKTAAS